MVVDGLRPAQEGQRAAAQECAGHAYFRASSNHATSSARSCGVICGDVAGRHGVAAAGLQVDLAGMLGDRRRRVSSITPFGAW